MRFIIFVLALFVTLLFLTGVSTADTVQECQKQCSTDLADSTANCPPPGKDTDKERSKCLKEIQSSLQDCREACVKFSSFEPPKDVEADEPEEKPADTMPVEPPDAPK